MAQRLSSMVGRVHGVSGLSVVDASIFPSIPSANTNVPTMMAAEHLSHVIPRFDGGHPLRLVTRETE
jgi:choline dehydrogenase-like flavoprotein